jgi:hypothetical protein
MRYYTESDSIKQKSLFIVAIEDTEILSKNYPLLSRFQEVVLLKLANMIAGYLFKKFKNEIIEQIDIQIPLVAGEIIRKEMLHHYGLPSNKEKE